MTIAAERHCAGGSCGGALPEVRADDGTVLFSARVIEPAYVHGEQVLCDTCVLARLNLADDITYADPLSIVEVIEEDAVVRAFTDAGLDPGALTPVSGSYHDDDHLRMVRYLDAAAVAAVARDLGAER